MAVEIEIGADAALAADGRDHRAAVIFLVLQADRDLRQPAVLVIDRIADQLQLGAEDILMKGEARPRPSAAPTSWVSKACQA